MDVSPTNRHCPTIDFLTDPAHVPSRITTRAGAFTNLLIRGKVVSTKSGMRPFNAAIVADRQPSYREGGLLMLASPIKLLIEDRRRLLGLTRRDVVRRAGYRNVSKGLRRLDELLSGEWRKARGLIDRLPAALDMPAETVNEAVSETDRQMRAAEDAAWRSAFNPHAIILTEHTRPTQITLAAICGADRKLRIDFEPRSNRISYIRQALDQVRRRSPIQFYGRAIGVIVNYSPNDAVRFDLTGNALEVLPAAYRPGELTVSIGGRPVPRDALEAIFSGSNIIEL
jgi:hypothetical protein